MIVTFGGTMGQRYSFLVGGAKGDCTEHPGRRKETVVPMLTFPVDSYSTVLNLPCFLLWVPSCLFMKGLVSNAVYKASS